MDDQTTPRYQSLDAIDAEQQRFIGSVYAWLAAVFGLWISPIFVFYTPGSITSTFMITVGWVITYVGVQVFAGFAATEAQMINEMRTTGIEGSDEETKEAVFGAMLFLVTFFNLFSFLTRIFGEED